MAKKAPGKAYRMGTSLKRLGEVLPEIDLAWAWLEKQIWLGSPHCGSFNVQCGIRQKTMTYCCRSFPKWPQFNLNIRAITQPFNLGYRDWVIVIYLLTTHRKGVSAMKLHRDLEIAYTSTFHVAHQLRVAYNIPANPRQFFYSNGLLNEFSLQLDASLRDNRAREYFGQREIATIEPLSRALVALPAA